MTHKPLLVALLVSIAGLVASSQQPPPAQPPSQPEVILSLTGEPGTLPRYAVPDFLIAGGDGDAALATTVAQVLWDDLQFEREFYMIPRDTYESIPPARSLSDASVDQWRELGADGLIIGSVSKTGDTMKVEVRLFDVRSHRSVFGKEYSGSAANPRFFAHTIADEIHQQQRALRGVARTRLAFVSDRDGEKVSGTVESRQVKEIYIADYDGANQRRMTITRNLNLTPAWSPDGRAVAYISFRRGYGDIFVSLIYQGLSENPTQGKGQNWLPSWSPDGSQMCFVSTRDGPSQIYVMNRDGSSVRRLTHNAADNTSPTWSPNGRQIAFTSGRSGSNSPQIWVMDADGLNQRKLTSESWCDRPTWSPAPFNEIAYSSRTGPGNDIKILDLATGQVRQITFGEGDNESPSYSPNGRHLAFMSTRAGKAQIFTIARDGKDLRQVTRTGNNSMPSWSR